MMGRLGRITQDESRGGFFISMENRLIIGIRREFEGQSRSINKTILMREGTGLDGKRFIELMQIEDTKTRCNKVLEEISPVLKDLMESFVEKYKDRYPELKEAEIHTHENTIKSARHAAGNENYPEHRRDSEIGKSTFISLEVDDGGKDYEIYRFKLNSSTKTIRIGVETGFSIFHNLYHDGILQQLTEKMDETFSYHAYYYGDGTRRAKDQMIPDIEKYISNKNTPGGFLGIEYPLEKEYSKDELLQMMNESWEKTVDLREAIVDELKKSHKIEQIRKIFGRAEGEYPFEYKGKQFVLTINEVKKHKPGHFHQDFSLKEHQQMFLKGRIHFSLTKAGRAQERLIVDVAGRMAIYFPIRNFMLGDNVPWAFPKAFAKEKKDNAAIKVDAYKRLREEGFHITDDERYYIGNFSASEESFDEPVEEVVSRLIKAAVIFTEVKGEIKIENEEPPIDEENLDEETEEADAPDWDFDFEKVIEIFDESELSFSVDVIRDLHLNLTSLDDKHFVVLSGISGTGKTQLAGLYSNSVYGLGDRDENPYLKVIPVRPDWMDATPLFGYYSVYERRYIKPEFLEFLLSALDNPRRPHFVLLDEMNLARVEYYLSDYLSAVESGKKVRLHDEEGLDVPKEIRIPPNLYMIGTINVDETTHSISDKVLDRAFVMHLSDVDFDMYWKKEDSGIKKELDEEFQTLRTIHKMLLPMDLHFGYRVMNEILRKLYRNKRLGEHGMEPKEAMDKVVAEKVLPKLRGDEKILPLLSEFLSWSKANLGEKGNTVKHLQRMNEELERYGTTQFWG